MYTDANLELAPTGTDASSGPYYSSSIDRTVSPDFGSGAQMAAAINLETYTVGSSSSSTFELVVSSAANLQTNPIVIGSITVAATVLENLDDATRKDAGLIYVRASPDPTYVFGIKASGVTQRYLGIRITHATDPSAMTVTANLVEGCVSVPGASYHASGIEIA